MRFAHLLEKSLCRFVSYKRIVDLSNKINYPIAPPITASISITQRCNSKCSYCDIWRLKDYYQDIPLDNFDRIFSSLKKLGVKLVAITGGEPLIRSDLEKIISLAKFNDMRIHVDTNGMLLTIERALRLKDAGVDSISMSLDTLDSKIYEKHRGIPFKFAQQSLTSLCNIANRFLEFYGNITCVITRHNIGTLATFINKISEYGGGMISVTLQPYHRPPSLQNLLLLYPDLQSRINELTYHYQTKPRDENFPGPELRHVFENEIRELILLKKVKNFPLHNSEYYLRNMPNFLFDNYLPDNIGCIAGYVGIVIRNNLDVCPCWKLPPVGNLKNGDLTDIWFSQRFRKNRIAMKYLKCPGCALLCHSEPAFYDYHNTLYKSRTNYANNR